MKLKFTIFAPLMVLLNVACFWNQPAEPGTLLLIRDRGAEVTAVESTGKHSRTGFWATYDVYDFSAKTVTWVDAELVTRDTQPIGYEIVIIYRRSRNSDEALEMIGDYNAAALNDEALAGLVLSQIPGVAKAVTTEFTLNEQLGTLQIDSEGNPVGDPIGRGVVEGRLFELLDGELEELHIELVDVGINNIVPSPAYVALLEEQANSRQAETNAVQLERQYVAELQAEKALTEIEVEQARRDNLVNQELAKTYDVSDRAYELERLRLMADLFGEGDKVWFIPQGTDLTLLLSQQGDAATPLPLGGQ